MKGIKCCKGYGGIIVSVAQVMFFPSYRCHESVLEAATVATLLICILHAILHLRAEHLTIYKWACCENC